MPEDGITDGKEMKKPRSLLPEALGLSICSPCFPLDDSLCNSHLPDYLNKRLTEIRKACDIPRWEMIDGFLKDPLTAAPDS